MSKVDSLLPVRAVADYRFCPRLFALTWMNGEWVDSADTIEGRRIHQRVDRPTRWKSKPGADRVKVATSLNIGDPELGLVARIDLLEQEGDEVIPVEYKKGRSPDNEEQSWTPDRVQVCAQALLLRAHGYTCNRGVIYYAGDRRRVAVPISQELVAETLLAREGARETADSPELPQPLTNDPRCSGCSLVSVCLPDEGNVLSGKCERVRTMVPPRDDASPLYVRIQGGKITKDHDEIIVRNRAGERVARARFEHTSNVVILGNVSLTTPLLRELAKRGIAVAYHSMGGWLYGTFSPIRGNNVLTRMAQHRAAQSEERSLQLARAFVATKIANCRVLLRRNGSTVSAQVLTQLKELVKSAQVSPGIDSLLGTEGLAARLYFQNFSKMLRGPNRQNFKFTARNRRPPRDPVNTLLSFAYACLARELMQVTVSLGLDAQVGFLHRPRGSRPTLALDLMEEFRPVIADSAVITAINKGIVQAKDFDIQPTGVALTADGRKRFIQAIERRLDEVATHPALGIRLSYRRILEVQARLLGKVLRGELETYPGYLIR